MEVNNYYPYGLLNSSLSYSRSGNRYKYQTKEVDNYFDYNILDFGARHYDPAVARWTAYDPASQYATPYIAMGGNPVSGIDPDGRKSHRMSDAQANLQQAQGEMAAVDNATGGGGAVPWYYYSSRDVAAMQLQYGTTYGQQTQEHFATLGMFGITGDIASATQQSDIATLYNENSNSYTYSVDARFSQQGNYQDYGEACSGSENDDIFNGYTINLLNSNGIRESWKDLNFDYGNNFTASGKVDFGNLVDHYMNRAGTNYYMSRNTFVDIVVKSLTKHQVDFSKGEPATGVAGLKWLRLDAYGTEYENSVGKARLYFTETEIVGYSDWWNFEGRGKGQRPMSGEIKTFLGSFIPGNPFWVLYGITPPTNLIPKH